MNDSAIFRTQARSLRYALAIFLAAMCAFSPLLSPAMGQDTALATAAPDQTATTPTAIPISDIVTQAEEASATLRNIEADLTSNTTIAVVEEQLPTLAREIDARLKEVPQILQARPSLETLREIEADWAALNENIPGWKRSFQTRAARLEKDIERLAALDATWQQTLESARNSEVPQELLQRVEATIAAIRQTRAQVEGRRSQILMLQSRVSEQEARLTETIASIREARGETISRLFVRDSPPIWSAGIRSSTAGDLVREGQDSLSTQRAALREYAARQTDRFILHALIIILLIAAIYLARRRVRPWVEAEPSLKPAATVFNLPITTAVLLSILVSAWIYPQAPRALNAILGAAALVPTILLLLRLCERELFPILNALVIFYFTDRLRGLAVSLPLMSRLLFLAEMLGGILFLVWLIKSSRLAKAQKEDRRSKIILSAARIGLIVFAVVLAANVLGYLSLARIIGNATLNSAYIAVVIYAALLIAYSLAMFALRVRPLRLLGMVRTHQELLLQRAQFALRWAAIIIWAILTLDLLAIREPIFAGARRVLTAELAVGAIHISPGDVLVFALTVWLAFLLSRFLRFALEEEVYTRVALARGIPYAVSTMLHYAVLLAGFFFAIAAMGINLDRFAILAGAFGVGIGFGLQNIVNNFVSGLILLFERPVKVGDVIQLGQQGGELKRIGLRASVLRTWEGSEVIVPNGGLISEEVINWTLSDQQRRMEIPVGVAYGTDPEQVLEILMGVAASHAEVMEEPGPQALFVGFGDNSLDFILRAWTNHFDRWMVIRSELLVAMNAALREADISIPFPQRDLHIQSVNKEVRKAIETMNDE